MKWVVESSLAAITWRSGKTATLRLSGSSSSSGPRSKRRLFIASGTLSGGGDSSLSRSSSSRRRLILPSLACMTTPCPIASWPPVTWKGSGVHVPLSVQAKPLEPLLAATPRLCFRPTCRPG
ncbi:unnamed protein product [Spirodela intermedia]|uniref:Uncharacterized protein n=1 Tax=Spirodela intermedia TaxID=51605 RepID=A0A7I8KEA2_SPIIN|nr:unnamed protein product [Spirodela intermedia]